MIDWLMATLVERKISRKQAAERLKLGQPYLSSLITGVKPLTLEVLSRMVILLGMPESLYWQFAKDSAHDKAVHVLADARRNLVGTRACAAPSRVTPAP